MNKFTLTLVDVRRVQRYLFNANELKQNLGASALVEQATHGWILDALPPKSNVQWDKRKYKITYDKSVIEGNNLDAEVIFMGGGNAAVLFLSHPQAVEFAKQYTCKLLSSAPGLEVAVGHVEVDWSQPEAMQAAWKRLQEEIMPRSKEGRAVPQPLLGLGVTAECAFTGLPAVADEPETPASDRRVLVSAEVRAKRNVDTIDGAKKRLNALMPPKEPFEYPDDFENLGGEKGKASYIAVVHADGNGIGKRIETYAGDPDNRKMIEMMREFSQALNQGGQTAMEAVCDCLRITPRLDMNDKWYIADSWQDNEMVRFENNFLPIRPVVFGGDEVTFVCDGRLGLALAVEFLKAFSKQKLPDGKFGYACAGVAIVHSHYPFARAYSLAEELAREAKRQARKWDDQARVSLLNWHYARSGLTLDWDDIRRREYENGNVLLRPLVVDKDNSVDTPGWRAWKVFLKQMQGFRQEWRWGRNKLKELRDTLRKSDIETEKFVALYGLLPDTGQPGLENVRKNGWYEGRCVYFDALEADDLFIYPSEVSHE